MINSSSRRSFADVDAQFDNQSTLYDIIANVTHESVAGTTMDKENIAWKVHLRSPGSEPDLEKWFMIQDLIVEEARKEMIFLGETVLQVSHWPFLSIWKLSLHD
jgi:U4/U6.U5 tri-snRNP-associated protein 2